MTQKAAIIKALTMLGGKAKLEDIYKLACKLGDFSGSKDPTATIRGYLNVKKETAFKKLADGVWALASYQEDIATRDRHIRELEEENAQLRTVRTEDDFVRRIVKETKKLYKHEKDKTEVIRQILYKVGRSDAEEELDAWIEGREYKPAETVAGAIADLNETLKKGVEEGVTVVNTQVYNKEVQQQNYHVAAPLLGNQKQKELTDGR